jgi:hypothetical protein
VSTTFLWKPEEKTDGNRWLQVPAFSPECHPRFKKQRAAVYSISQRRLFASEESAVSRSGTAGGRS